MDCRTCVMLQSCMSCEFKAKKVLDMTKYLYQFQGGCKQKRGVRMNVFEGCLGRHYVYLEFTSSKNEHARQISWKCYRTGSYWRSCHPQIFIHVYVGISTSVAHHSVVVFLQPVQPARRQMCCSGKFHFLEHRSTHGGAKMYAADQKSFQQSAAMRLKAAKQRCEFEVNK